MLRNGVYRTREAGSAIERHGGKTINHNIYWYLCFYLPQKKVALYGTQSKDYLKPYEDNHIELKGEITVYSNCNLEFYILNTDTGINILFKGEIKEELLYLKYYHQNKPEEIFEDVFEYIGTGEGKN